MVQLSSVDLNLLVVFEAVYSEGNLTKVVEATDLLVTLPRRLATSFESQERFRLLPPPFSIPPLTLMLYWHERFNGDPANRWLRTTIAELDL